MPLQRSQRRSPHAGRRARRSFRLSQMQRRVADQARGQHAPGTNCRRCLQRTSVVLRLGNHVEDVCITASFGNRVVRVQAFEMADRHMK